MEEDLTARSSGSRPRKNIHNEEQVVQSRQGPKSPQAASSRASKNAEAAYNTPSDSASEDSSLKLDKQPAVPVLLRRNIRQDSYEDSSPETPEIIPAVVISGSNNEAGKSQSSSDSSTTKMVKKTYIVASDDAELRRLLKRELERGQGEKGASPSRRQKKAQFRDMVFIKQFSAFDRQNELSASSPFHGFYVLFWIAVTMAIVKMAAENWRRTGNPLGTNELMKYMFARDVLVLLISDGLMCGITGVSWVLQRLVLSGYVDWNRSGWIIQNIWQTLFIAGVVGMTLVRDWPWTHTVYFVLHGLIMVMKQHSYAFYNGHLSSIYKEQQKLLFKLKQLEGIEPAATTTTSTSTTTDSAISDSMTAISSSLSTSPLTSRPSASKYYERRRRLSKNEHQHDHHEPPALSDSDRDSGDIKKIDEAIKSGQPLDSNQLDLFSHLIKWEIAALGDELKGKVAGTTEPSSPSSTSSSKWYPHNTTTTNFYEYVVLPTLVYELQYPRSARINWWYVAEKTAAMVGVIFVMAMVSQTFIYPVVVRTLAWKEELGWDTRRRFEEFPWLLSDLVFPFMMEYLLAWYLIWETVLNILAELSCFADRSFYDAWWNSVSWDQYARDWNRPVHGFLLRHVYHSSISAMRVRRETATLMTFFLSACVHELVMACIFRKLRGYLLVMQMCQLPLVRLSRTPWLRGRRTLGNMIFWVGIFTGPSLLCSLYLIL